MHTELLQKYGLDQEARQRRKDFLGITAADEQAIARLRGQFSQFAERLAEGFYRHLLAYPETAELLDEPGLLARLKEAQMAYFHELVSGDYGHEYFEKRLRIGEIHNAVGLEPNWYLGAYNQYVQLTFPFFAEQGGGQMPPELLALIKVIFLDIDLALQTYFAAHTEKIRQHNEELEHAVGMYFQAELKAQQYAKLAGHEIRGALQAISAVCETIAEDYADELPPEAREALQSAHRRCLNTHQIVESILAQPDKAGEPTWVDVPHLMHEVAARAEQHAGERSVEFSGISDPLRVWGDPIGLREVFANLVSNAVHYSDKSPIRIAVAYTSRPEEHVFSVADNGPGIPPELRERIFEPFFRGGAPAPHRGRGLGLHFVRTIISRHGGHVWVESVPGEGARFHFSVPKEPTPRA
ncbi:MAG: hypothetical protein JNG90_17660 [Planctomycetaceae bacterium]|nr:hypothetical protein [Planctomycetaceae bacterium]